MLLTISVTVIAAIMVVAVVALIPVLLKIRQTAQEIEKLADTVRLQVAPISHELTKISQEVSGILKTIRRQVDKVDESLSAVRDTAIRLREFEEQIQEKIETPLLELAVLMSAFTRGAKAFIRVLRR